LIVSYFILNIKKSIVAIKLIEYKIFLYVLNDKKTPSLAAVPNRNSEPVFVNLLRSPGTDSQPGGPVRQPY
jgi:hypothetical protein